VAPGPVMWQRGAIVARAPPPNPPRPPTDAPFDPPPPPLLLALIAPLPHRAAPRRRWPPRRPRLRPSPPPPRCPRSVYPIPAGDPPLRAAACACAGAAAGPPLHIRSGSRGAGEPGGWMGAVRVLDPPAVTLLPGPRDPHAPWPGPRGQFTDDCVASHVHVAAVSSIKISIARLGPALKPRRVGRCAHPKRPRRRHGGAGRCGRGG
jgi:hypothetical protein